MTYKQFIKKALRQKITPVCVISEGDSRVQEDVCSIVKKLLRPMDWIILNAEASDFDRIFLPSSFTMYLVNWKKGALPEDQIERLFRLFRDQRKILVLKDDEDELHEFLQKRKAWKWVSFIDCRRKTTDVKELIKWRFELAGIQTDGRTVDHMVGFTVPYFVGLFKILEAMKMSVMCYGDTRPYLVPEESEESLLATVLLTKGKQPLLMGGLSEIDVRGFFSVLYSVLEKVLLAKTSKRGHMRDNATRVGMSTQQFYYYSDLARLGETREWYRKLHLVGQFLQTCLIPGVANRALVLQFLLRW